MTYRLRQTPKLGCFGDSGVFLGEPPAVAAATVPVFRLDCQAADCALPTLGDCQRVLRRAAADAIQLCLNAATKLDAHHPSTVKPFIFFFGHVPTRPVPWAGGKESGAVVAFRFRKIAEALHKRVIHFRCVCANGGAGAIAVTNWQAEHNVINLCAGFWNPPAGLPVSDRFFRASVLLHEVLHLLFESFFHHQGHPSGDPERRRDNAHCYDAFALRLAGHTPPDIPQCRDRLA
jgi:hypothetical protein